MRESERVRNKRMKKGNFFHCSTIDNFFGSILGLYRPLSVDEFQ
jgi:hypothetical protein